jgi:hypothetical protein
MGGAKMPIKKMRPANIDLATGKVEEGVFVYCPKKHLSPFTRGGFGVMSFDAALMLACSDLDGADLKVLWLLIANLETDNYILINQTELANIMGLKRPHFNRSIKKLLAKDILLEGTNVGRLKSYRLNAYYGWRGSVENHVKALEIDPIPLKDRMKQSGIEAVIDGGKEIK